MMGRQVALKYRQKHQPGNSLNLKGVSLYKRKRVWCMRRKKKKMRRRKS
jgi:hypothetical protein